MNSIIPRIKFPIALSIMAFILLNSWEVFAGEVSPLGFIGIISKSERYKKGSQYTFANISSDKPIVTYPSGFGNEAIKVYEDDELVVLFYIASVTGSTETYYLNKKNKRFTLIEVGAFEATVEGKDYIPKVTYGALK